MWDVRTLVSISQSLVRISSVPNLTISINGNPLETFTNSNFNWAVIGNSLRWSSNKSGAHHGISHGSWVIKAADKPPWQGAVAQKENIQWKHAVDGWNPAPPGMYETLKIMGYITYQLVQDFFHQQYHNYRVESFTPNQNKTQALLHHMFFVHKNTKTTNNSMAWKMRIL